MARRKKEPKEPKEKKEKGAGLNKKKIIIIAGAVVLLIAIAGAGVFAMKKLKGKKGGKEASTTEVSTSTDENTGEATTGDGEEDKTTSEGGEEGTTELDESAAASTIDASKFAEYGDPYFARVMASSTLKGDKSSAYSPDCVTDLDPKTAWAEGIENVGIGEWIDLSSKSEQYVKGVKILNGYCKSPEVYKKNCRPKTISIYSVNGLVKTVNLADKYGEYQTIEFDQPVLTTYLRFSIDDVYDGTTYDDTCISEIEVY